MNDSFNESELSELNFSPEHTDLIPRLSDFANRDEDENGRKATDEELKVLIKARNWYERNRPINFAREGPLASERKTGGVPGFREIERSLSDKGYLTNGYFDSRYWAIYMTVADVKRYKKLSEESKTN